MKRTCLIIIALMAMVNTFAGNEVVSSSDMAVNDTEATTEFVCENCLLSFSKDSKVVIKNEYGQVIFYNDSVQDLDISSWASGSYVVKVNDKETFEFSI